MSDIKSAGTQEFKMNPSVTEPTIIGIASGKGGVGKSTVAVNLSFAFANLGKRTVLLDADLGLANAQISLGLRTEFNFSHEKHFPHLSRMYFTLPSNKK